jgi:plasmid stabilization system protein ParE
VTIVRFTRRAVREVERIEAWWKANRGGTPDRFVSELAQAITLLGGAPQVGPKYQEGPKAPVRRLLLPRTQFHVYYRYQPAKDVVEILTVWSTRRGRGPSLR